ncbi:PA2169 family four-helix-bundle protein [Dokdonia sinensis]|uniref:PA2169 family four-helix-bundle protein n=1 Tax=Dokdonia sinensis TaxID=2479847 RepID=A0A3M0G0K1_9FLAO|nr:PA2169 family four-helix-bundle protein [Dokdonia sinensis]RMB58501.1 PA2169 family four-helix-bundle protein [Dokdonia sinensis]
MSYTEKVSNRLNDLLTKNYDAEAGYKQAAEKVSNPKLKNFFNQRAKERYDFGHELKSEIKSFGQEPEKGTSFTGDAHRTWIDIKTAFSSDKDEAVLEEAIRGEKAAVAEYNEVLSETSLPPSTANLITKERDSVQNALNNVKSLEEWA